MPDGLLAPGRARELARAAGRRLSLGPDDGCATGGTRAGHPERTSPARAPLGTTATISGITSPARWTTTVSPTRTSVRRTSSALWRVARLTITPLTRTGSRCATGVSVPVRPTWTAIRSTRVRAAGAGNLRAIARRGARATKPSLLVEAVHFEDHAVDLVGQALAPSGHPTVVVGAAIEAPGPRRSLPRPAGPMPGARRGHSRCASAGVRRPSAPPRRP